MSGDFALHGRRQGRIEGRAASLNDEVHDDILVSCKPCSWIALTKHVHAATYLVEVLTAFFGSLYTTVC